MSFLVATHIYCDLVGVACLCVSAELTGDMRSIDALGAPPSGKSVGTGQSMDSEIAAVRRPSGQPVMPIDRWALAKMGPDVSWARCAPTLSSRASSARSSTSSS